jgi:Holliday junction resolvase
MRTRGRVDANQPEIVKALRDIGCSVAIISNVGGGVPDLLVGRNGCNILLEIKDGTRKPSERALSDDEQTFMESWRGQYEIAESVQFAVQYVLANS